MVIHSTLDNCYLRHMGVERVNILGNNKPFVSGEEKNIFFSYWAYHVVWEKSTLPFSCKRKRKKRRSRRSGARIILSVSIKRWKWVHNRVLIVYTIGVLLCTQYVDDCVNKRWPIVYTIGVLLWTQYGTIFAISQHTKTPCPHGFRLLRPQDLLDDCLR